MATLVFDIETVGESWENVDTETKKILTRWIDRTTRAGTEREAMVRDMYEGLGFSPLTGFIVAIGLYDIDRQQGVVYYTGNSDAADTVEGNYLYKQRSEEAMLTEFWDGAQQYDTFVTFNGRGFDVPFLIHRSLIKNIAPTKNLMEGRYPSQQKTCRHVDLQDEMTFYGAMYRRPSLHLFCRAYGITSPKEGVDGDDVAKLFADKQFRDIALYNARDVTATALLYERWKQYGVNFLAEPLIDF